jgi:hypothetical protein
MTDHPRAPAHIDAYVRVLGVDGAVTFLLHFGGAELYVAASPKGRGRLVDVMGMDAATALSGVVDKLPRRVPTAKPWIAKVLKQRGLSVAEIARKLHTSDVTVRRYLSETPADPRRDDRQSSLF